MTLPPNNQTPPLGDDGFGRHYQAGSQELPGAAADAAVLALARAAATESRARAFATRAGGDAEARGWSRRWQAPLALAACLVLAVGVVTRMQTQLPDATGVADPVATSATSPPVLSVPKSVAEPAPVVVAAAPFSPRPEPTRVQPGLTASAEKTGDSRRAAAPAAEAMSASGTPSVASPNSAPATAPAPPPQPRNETVATDRKPEAAEAGKARMVDAAGAADAGITPVQDSMLTPRAWLARIIELRSNGRVAEADASLKRFRERHPSVQVPLAASGQPE